ncbi:NnrU family protein [Rhizobium halophytocola]|uniref:Membrane protein n=1 Tax=Rhizobium halophytocola TaxID=735519 RepID=A0ABS4E609_9HYPH|nr:NnrU family protein [Rhizobium halophytocola]MBP1853385.1 putative membrane protein [Rhizobium halophytocola]
MAILILGIILFLGVHSIRLAAPGFRRSMVEKMGEGPWRGVYSAASLVSLVILIWGFAVAPVINVWFPPEFMSHITVLLMLFAMICFIASLMPAGHIQTKTKHPMVLSVKIWAFAHLLANGDLASILLFVAFLAWGVVMRIALKKRWRRGELMLPSFVSARYDVIAVVVGVVVWAALLLKLHELLIGVAPIPAMSL